jgi:hypothetical protein
MMGEGAFRLLKTSRLRPETAKQAEICLATFLKILLIARFGSARSDRKLPADDTQGGIGVGLPLEMANLQK